MQLAHPRTTRSMAKDNPSAKEASKAAVTPAHTFGIVQQHGHREAAFRLAQNEPITELASALRNTSEREQVPMGSDIGGVQDGFGRLSGGKGMRDLRKGGHLRALSGHILRAGAQGFWRCLWPKTVECPPQNSVVGCVALRDEPFNSLATFKILLVVSTVTNKPSTKTTWTFQMPLTSPFKDIGHSNSTF
eukprot:1140405-Pelagomonas_calceolata.AAC.1